MKKRVFGQDFDVRGQLTVAGAAFAYSLDVSTSNYVQFWDGTGSVPFVSFQEGRLGYDPASGHLLIGSNGAFRTIALNDDLNNVPILFPVTQTAHGFMLVGMPVSKAGTDWVAADITDNTKSCDGFIQAILDANTFRVQTLGRLALLTSDWDAIAGTSGGLTAGEFYALGAAGTITSTPTGAYEQVLGRAISATEFLIVGASGGGSSVSNTAMVFEAWG